MSSLLSDRLDRKLGLRERVRLRIHLAMCTGCSRVQRQLEFLREALTALVKPPHRK